MGAFRSSEKSFVEDSQKLNESKYCLRETTMRLNRQREIKALQKSDVVDDVTMVKYESEKWRHHYYDLHRLLTSLTNI